jgi:hypothetical protein
MTIIRGRFICLVLAFLTFGCDPAGLRRVELKLHAPSDPNSHITVESPDVQEALQTLDGIAVRHGFQRASDTSEHVKIYRLTLAPVTVDGRTYSLTILWYVSVTPVGLEVVFSEQGFLKGNQEADSLFVDVRDTFIKKYGEKNVTSQRRYHPQGPLSSQ